MGNSKEIVAWLDSPMDLDDAYGVTRVGLINKSKRVQDIDDMQYISERKARVKLKDAKGVELDEFGELIGVKRRLLGFEPDFIYRGRIRKHLYK